MFDVKQLTQTGRDKSNTFYRDRLSLMNECEILAAVKAMEATYKENPTPIDQDHRQHLSRKELETVFGLACRVLEHRRIDRDSVLKPFFKS